MLSYDDALREVLATSVNCKSEVCPLSSALGRYLAQDVIATLNHPPFPQSAMDGFAIADPGPSATSQYTLNGEFFAGSTLPNPLESGQCYKVATGGPLPPNCYADVPKEDASLEGQTLSLDKFPPKGRWIRATGMDVQKGEVLLNAGTFLNSGRLSNLAQQGIDSVEVHQLPNVAVLTSGDEVVSPKLERQPHQIFNSNQTLVSSLLSQSTAKLGDCVHVRDDRAETHDVLVDLAKTHDLIITTGGASVGERDFLIETLRDNGSLGFWKVKMRPGKPVFIGEFNGAKVLGLPGNPVSTFASFHLFARPLLERMAGAKCPSNKWAWMPWPENIKPHPTRRDFLRASWKPSSHPNEPPYQLASGQTSGHGSDLLSTDLLVEIPSREEEPEHPKNSVRVFFL